MAGRGCNYDGNSELIRSGKKCISNVGVIDVRLVQIAVNCTSLVAYAWRGGLVMAHKYGKVTVVVVVATAPWAMLWPLNLADTDAERPFQSATAKTPILGLSPRSSTDMEGIFESRPSISSVAFGATIPAIFDVRH